MVTEIYACGHNRTSAFIIVEAANIIHYGSHTWGETISFNGINAPSSDLNCEVIAVICALMLCENNHRGLVNIYTDDDSCQQRYFRRQCDSPFFSSVLTHLDGVDIYAESWRDNQFGEDFKAACKNMTNNNQNGIQQR